MIDKCEYCRKNGHHIRQCNDERLLRRLYCLIEINDLAEDNLFRDDVKQFVRNRPAMAHAFVKRFCNTVPDQLTRKMCVKLIYNHIKLLWVWKAKVKGVNPFDLCCRGELQWIETFGDEMLAELLQVMRNVPGANVPTHPCDESLTYARLSSVP